MKLQLEAYKNHMNNEIAEFKKEMHNVISSIPPEIANMTVEDYIKKYLKYAGEVLTFLQITIIIGRC